MSLADVVFILSEYVGVGALFRLMRVCRAFRRDLLHDKPVWASVTRRMQLARPLPAAAVVQKMRLTSRCRECGTPRVPRGGPPCVCTACAADPGGYSELVPFSRVREMAQLAHDRGFVRSLRSLARDLRVVRRTRPSSTRLVWRANVEELLYPRSNFNAPDTSS